MAAALLMGFATLAAAPSAQAAAPAGSLQRTAAAMDDTLDVYRLALIELVPALRLVLEAGQQPRAVPTTPVPALAHEVFARLVPSVQRRISADALTAVPRAYHSEIVEAAEALADAQYLEQVRAPAKSLGTALHQQGQLAADIVDLFSRQRPILTEVVGPEQALDGINDALGQLQLAEVNIGTVRRRQGSLGEQLQGFLRLEIALGHALDLIVAAEQSGVQLGFEMSRATVGLAAHLEQMRQRLAALEAVVAAMEQPPGAIKGAVQAEAHRQAPPGGGTEAVLAWTPPSPGGHAPAVVRLYPLRCAAPAKDGRMSQSPPPLPPDGQTAAAHTSRSDGCVAVGSPIELAPGRSSAKLPWPPPQGGQVPTHYRLASVSAFGVEHSGPIGAVLDLPATLAPPSRVSAALPTTRYDSPLFYHDAVSVQIAWQASLSDVADSAPAQTYAQAQRLPTLARYAVYRLGRAGAELVGQTPAGVTHIVDRPAVGQLQQGIAYRVLAIDAAGGAASAPARGDVSATLCVDVQDQLTLAAAGAAALSYPTDFERRTTQRLAAPTALSLARGQFAALPETTRQRLWQGYWHRASMSERVGWYETWVERMSPAQRAAAGDQLPQSLAQRDRGMVQAGLWALQNPTYANEASRYFGLLTAHEQRQAVASWRQAMGPKVAHAFDAAMADEDAGNRQTWQLPLMQGVWFASRDADEQLRLCQSLQDLPPQRRQALEHSYMRSLPMPLRQAVRWPVWESLTPEERDAYLNVPPDIRAPDGLADGLWPAFLAWVAYEQLSVDDKRVCITEQIGRFAHGVSRLRYWARPLDVLCGFRLWLYASLLALGFVNGVLLRLISRPQRR